jgi:hypothetical protein
MLEQEAVREKAAVSFKRTWAYLEEWDEAHPPPRAPSYPLRPAFLD